jgi:hypothetical protein
MLAKKLNMIQNASVLKNFLSGVLKSPNYKLGDLQNVEYLFVAGFQFREEFVRMQLKCNLLVGDQDRAYLFRNARNREDAAQRLQIVHWELSFEETFHRRFAVLALNVHGLFPRSKPYRFRPD